MNKKYSLILAFLITGLIANMFYIFQEEEKINTENGKILRVIDGDTIELEDGRKVRLLNINTPEKNEMGSELGKEFLKKLENKSIKIEILGEDKYKRNLGRIYYDQYINLELVKNGFAVKFLVEEDELKEFDNAEKEAIKNSKGIWKKSNFSECLNVKIDKYKEFVKINNKCSEINFKNWILRDESRKKYLFPNFHIEEITLYSGTGENNEKELFWNSKTNIWNNDRDTLYIFDSGGGIAYYESYGY